MKLIECVYGINPWEVLIRLAAGEVPAISNQHIRYAGVWMLHPGAGTVTAIAGLEKARQVPGVTSMNCPLVVGDFITERIGSGESIGQIFAEASDRDSCARILRQASSLVKIDCR